MNIENINRLIGVLEKVDPKKFNMADWIIAKQDDDGNECGTAGCICGWAAMIEYPEIKGEWEAMAEHLENEAKKLGRESYWGTYTSFGMRWFDIDEITACALFQPDRDLVCEKLWNDGHMESAFYYKNVTPAMAVDILSILRDTGTIEHTDWADVYVKHGGVLRTTP